MSTPVDVSNSDDKKYLTAFVVLIGENGTPAIISDLDPEMWSMDHKANPREIRRAILEISADFQTQAVFESFSAMLAEQKPQTTADIVSDALSRRVESNDD